MTLESGARFSVDRAHRYELWRRWDSDRPNLVVVGLNPSKANEIVNDPTVRRCIGFAQREGCGGLVMLNLFSFCATRPGDMMIAPDPVGPDNDATIEKYLGWRVRDVILAAWGAYGGHMDRDKAIIARYGPRLAALGLTRFGKPRHPLYMRADAPLIYPWRST